MGPRQLARGADAELRWEHVFSSSHSDAAAQSRNFAAFVKLLNVGAVFVCFCFRGGSVTQLLHLSASASQRVGAFCHLSIVVMPNDMGTLFAVLLYCRGSMC